MQLGEPRENTKLESTSISQALLTSTLMLMLLSLLSEEDPTWTSSICKLLESNMTTEGSKLINILEPLTLMYTELESAAQQCSSPTTQTSVPSTSSGMLSSSAHKTTQRSFFLGAPIPVQKWPMLANILTSWMLRALNTKPSQNTMTSLTELSVTVKRES